MIGVRNFDHQRRLFHQRKYFKDNKRYLTESYRSIGNDMSLLVPSSDQHHIDAHAYCIIGLRIHVTGIDALVAEVIRIYKFKIIRAR